MWSVKSVVLYYLIAQDIFLYSFFFFFAHSKLKTLTVLFKNDLTIPESWNEYWNISTVHVSLGPFWTIRIEIFNLYKIRMIFRTLKELSVSLFQYNTFTIYHPNERIRTSFILILIATRAYLYFVQLTTIIPFIIHNI